MKSNIKVDLTSAEKKKLRTSKVKMSDLHSYSADELEVLLGASADRAKEVHALIEFQQIPSIGIEFARDLIALGYYAIDELKHKQGAKLTDDFEKLKGFWIDPCVEDQFRLAVYYANTRDKSKNWWAFTKERKQYREQNGYPASRPKTAWHESIKSKAKQAK